MRQRLAASAVVRVGLERMDFKSRRSFMVAPVARGGDDKSDGMAGRVVRASGNEVIEEWGYDTMKCDECGRHIWVWYPAKTTRKMAFGPLDAALFTVALAGGAILCMALHELWRWLF